MCCRLEEAVGLLQSRTARDDAAGATDACGRSGLPTARSRPCCGLLQSHADAASPTMRLRLRASLTQLRVAQAIPGASPRPSTSPLRRPWRSVKRRNAHGLSRPVRARTHPNELVEGAIEDEAERLKALAALAEVSLLKHDPFEDGTPAVTVHRLVQAVARARSEAKGSAQDAVERLIARLVAIYPVDEPYRTVVVGAMRQLTPHLLALRETRTMPQALDWADLLDAGGRPIWTAAQLTTTLRAAYLRCSSQSVRNCLDPSIPIPQTSLSDPRRLLQFQDDHAAARPLLERALAIREKVLGPEHPLYGACLDDLGSILRSGRLSAARPLFERALASGKKCSAQTS